MAHSTITYINQWCYFTDTEFIISFNKEPYESIPCFIAKCR